MIAVEIMMVLMLMPTLTLSLSCTRPLVHPSL